MTRDSMEKLRLDRRLLRRRGWIGAKELEAALDSLPDVAGKAITLGEAEGRDAAGTDAEARGTA